MCLRLSKCPCVRVCVCVCVCRTSQCPRSALTPHRIPLMTRRSCRCKGRDKEGRACDKLLVKPEFSLTRAEFKRQLSALCVPCNLVSVYHTLTNPRTDQSIAHRHTHSHTAVIRTRSPRAYLALSLLVPAVSFRLTAPLQAGTPIRLVIGLSNPLKAVARLTLSVCCVLTVARKC